MTTPLPTPEQALAAANRILGAGRIVRCLVHDYDQSVELFAAPDTPAAWVPGEDQLKAVCALGFVTVYCNFADDTEFIGSWRTRIIDGRKQPGGDYWVMSPRRDRVGFLRYQNRG
jgi:hypothetical protein